ncbi:thioredoxin [Pseudoxanthomonas sp. CAU 1598]|uniref:Thioredoxin n=1 Tax=Pseudomarimonas arenosa TaxID=2774145 RepID=A0AAW3ZPV5_9GAMM|nr:thioredoxin [Pseudomarimonas arenosa]MBD8528228.1 thioredoxin [Pseudomarimonas arenosa]
MTDSPPPAHSFDVATASFEQDVLARSMDVPVLVDFWADWCAPCKQLKPILEKLAAEYGGSFVLAKINSDEEQQLPALFGVRSLPTVILLKGGRPVDGFMGALPESQVREFLSRHEIVAADGAGNESEIESESLSPEQALADVEARIAADPNNDELQLDLAVALSRVGEVERAGNILDQLPAKLATDDRAKRVQATLGFAATLRDAPPLNALEHRLAQDESNLEAHHLAGVHYLVAGDYEAALHQFIELLRRDKQWNDGLAKKLLIDAFNIIDDEDLVGRYRRKMSSLLF